VLVVFMLSSNIFKETKKKRENCCTDGKIKWNLDTHDDDGGGGGGGGGDDDHDDDDDDG
jgi:hypothetical protein